VAKPKGIFKKVFLLLFFCAASVVGYWVYQNIFKSNVDLNGKNFTYIYIKTGYGLQDVLDELYSQNIIDDHESFAWTAKQMKLSENIIPGKYRIDSKMSNRSIVKMIINGKQEKVKLSLNSQIRTKEQFIEYISDKLEIEESELEDYCLDNENLNTKFGLNADNFMCLITPKVYEVNWTIHIDDLFKLFKNSYDEVWTKDKLTKTKSLGYDVQDIITLASIVQSESSIDSEQRKIAGVYINRLKKDMKLQADPTVVFANESFDVQRVLSADKEIDSPYNTYKYKGLPPGPICLVKPSSIDAVLNYAKHDYIYFCAKSDFSGYSNFSNNYNTHMKNAAEYQGALNRKGIKR
jgi:UPF0755 protein